MERGREGSKLQAETPPHGLRKTPPPVHLAAATASESLVIPHLGADVKRWLGVQGSRLTATRSKQDHADDHEPPALPFDARDEAARVPDIRRLAKGAPFSQPSCRGQYDR